MSQPPRSTKVFTQYVYIYIYIYIDIDIDIYIKAVKRLIFLSRD